MSFASPHWDGHERVLFWHDPATGVQAIAALHRILHGRALGGCRVRAYATPEDAIADVLRLSRGMTYKAALADLPCGGAKAVLIGDPRTVKTPAALRSVGRMVASLDGVYVTAEDVGMTQADLREIKQETPWVLGADDVGGVAAPWTALGVFHALRGAVRQVLGRERLDGLRVAVQGVGAVGRELCALLAASGCRLVVADLDEEAVARMVAEHGAEPVAPDRIHAAAVDVYSPCALGAALNARTIGEIRARIVVGAANNQLETAADGLALHAAGIAYVADYLASAGGICNGFTELEGYDRARARARVEAIEQTAVEVLDEAARDGVAASVAADRLAERRMAADPAACF